MLPLDVRPLFRPLDDLLMELLRSLTQNEWNAPTVARLWKVKDVAAHLLDGNIRLLSLQRDRYFGETPPEIRSNEDLVQWLNALNADWVKASRRISPSVLLLLHEATRGPVNDYYVAQDLFTSAIFPVSWAGETESQNWMHLAREYSEKWLHQQQIRDAVNRPALLAKQWFYPLAQTFAYALPYTYRHTQAPEGTVVQLHISSDAGGVWAIRKTEQGWKPAAAVDPPASRVVLDPDTAWKLFSKSWRAQQVQDRVTIEGDRRLGLVALDMVSVMA